MSDLEETFAGLLRLSGLTRRVGAPEREYRFAPPRRWRFDFAWPDVKIAAEVEGGTFSGGRHTRGSGFEADCEKYAEAVVLGWKVFRFTGAMVEDGRALSYLERVPWGVYGPAL